MRALSLCLLVTALPAAAAQITDVADAVDGELKFDVSRHSGTLTRENFQPPENQQNGTPRTVDGPPSGNR